MLLYENKKAKLLTFLKNGINPFDKFVSTGEIKEDLGFVSSRNEFLNSIMQTIRENKNFILPIIGEVGTGKTHLFWVLKNILYYFNTIYISLATLFKKFFYNIYSEFIEAIGSDPSGKIDLAPLRNIISQLCNDWGALERKFGFFHVADIEKIKKQAFEKLSPHFGEKEKITLYDIINGITIHQLDPYNKADAERWLLGEIMDERDLTRLNMKHDLKKDKNAFIMLKILIENSKLGTVLFIDDFEKIIDKPQEEDSEEVFDPSWLYGNEQTPDDIKSEKLFKKIIELTRINGLRIIITLKSIDSLEMIKRKLQDLEISILPSIKNPLFVRDFEYKDIFEFYNKNMKSFYEQVEFNDFYEEFSENYFPLNLTVLQNLYYKTEGNPRKIIKYLIKIFNEIIYSDDEVDRILKMY